MPCLRSFLRYLWVLPASLVGLVFALFAYVCGARWRWVDGVLEVAGGILARFKRRIPFRAITLGHVIIGVEHEALARCRKHERVHVRQYERWGVFFFVLYLGSSVVAMLRKRHPYWDNYFERQAYREEDQD
jgi:hypothetical protein